MPFVLPIPIRINNQWRICFEWPDGDDGPSNVEITDYH
jgi:addiction module HigA family antidote